MRRKSYKHRAAGATGAPRRRMDYAHFAARLPPGARDEFLQTLAEAQRLIDAAWELRRAAWQLYRAHVLEHLS
jgi:hypothetical protein